MPTIEERANLRGKRGMIVGGAYGIGEAITLALAESGCELAVCDNDAVALPNTTAVAEAAGVSVFSRAFDALDVKALAAFYADAGERLGHLDFVVNVVGGTHMLPFDETGPDAWADDIQRNFGYVIHSTKAALPLLRKSGRGGSIVNFTTIEAHRGAATLSVYAGAKAATTNFSRSLATELGRDRIRVNTLAPDMTPSRGNTLAPAPWMLEGMMTLPESVLRQSPGIALPLVNAPTPSDIANGVLFLVSDLSVGVTGTVLHVDGGTHGAAGFNYWPHDDAYSPLPLANTLRRMFHDEIPPAS